MSELVYRTVAGERPRGPVMPRKKTGCPRGRPVMIRAVGALCSGTSSARQALQPSSSLS